MFLIIIITLLYLSIITDMNNTGYAKNKLDSNVPQNVT